MSDEYRILGGGAATLNGIGRCLATFGLRETAVAPDALSLCHEGNATDQIQRWGGNLRIEREGNDLIVTFNAVADRRRVLAQILEAIAAQGVLASAVAL